MQSSWSQLSLQVPEVAPSDRFSGLSVQVPDVAPSDRFSELSLRVAKVASSDRSDVAIFSRPGARASPFLLHRHWLS
jgi:hypothetical protein